MTEARAPFPIGDVVSRSFRVVIDHLGAFAAIAAIGLVPFAATMYSVVGDMVTRQGGPPAEPPTWLMPVYLVQWATGLIGYGATIHATIAALDGRPVRVGESLAAGARRAFPLLGVSIVAGIAIGAASLLLVVPGLILLTAWYMAFPIAIVERRGVFGALGRAAALSKGYRLSLFGLGVVSFLLAIAGYIGAGMVGGIAALIANAIAGKTGVVVVFAILGSCLYLLMSAVFTAMIAVAYHDLRTIKDGGSPEQLADVFA